jgi:choice-of-anchor A domain-containing protein
MGQKLLQKVFLFSLLLVFTCTVKAQSPTSSAQGFNIFLKNGAKLATNETEGPIALGGDLEVAGNYQVNIHNNGTFAVGNIPIGLFVGGKVILTSGSLQVNSGRYVKIGNCASSNIKVWYRDNNNAASNIYVTTSGGSYASTPNVNINSNATTWGTPEVSASNKPVCDANTSTYLDFNAAFNTFQSNATSMAACSAIGIDLTNPNGNVHGTTISSVLTGGQFKINLSSGTNVLNCTGTELNSVTNGVTFNTQPDASHVLVINVNASGSFTWNVWNQAGIGGNNSPYIIYNFYNCTSLNIAGNSTIEGTVFAPYADITKTVNQSNIEGQVIGLSFYQNGGEVHYYPFTPAVTGCGSGCTTAPTVADITGNTTVCKNSTITLSNTTAGGTWSSSNTSVATVSSNGVVTGVTAGTITISYAVSNGCGTTTKTASVTVSDAPTVANIIGNTTVCKNSTITLSNTTAGGTWSSSNTSVATVSSSGVVTGVAAGTVTISYAVSNSCGTTTKTASVTVNDAPTVADITGNTTVCKNSTITLSDATAGGTWSSSDISVATVSNTGVVTGIKTGTVTISYAISNGCGTTTKTKSIVVGDVITVNDITGTTTVCKGSTTALSNSTAAGTWSSSNTSVATVDANGVVTGIAAGTSTISYSVTNSCGISTKSVTVTVNDVPSNVFTVNNTSQQLSGNNFVFTYSGSTTGNTFNWNFGDATTSTSVNPAKTYAAQGSYHVTLNVANINGCSSSSSTNVSVTTNPVVPTTIIPGFHVDNDNQCITNNSFHFTNISISKCGCLTYLWNFGDGTTSTETNPVKTYAAAGEYVVKLVITDKDHQQDSVSYHVFVVNSPNVDFTANPTSVECFKGNKFTFTNTSHGAFSGLKYTWDFGNGATSTETNPSINYTAPGNYTVTLRGTFNDVCPAVISHQIIVNPSPVTDFSYAVDAGNSKKINFNNATTVTSGELDYNWFFGDNNSAVDKNPFNVYAKNGVYTVTLIASGKNTGCADSITKTITVGNNVFSVGFGVGTTTQCFNNNKFTFSNNSIGTTGSSLSYVWNFGDGTTSTDKNPVKSYTAIGDYSVKLVVTSSKGDKDSITTILHVLASPTAQFTVSPSTEYCLSANNLFTFSSTSIIPLGNSATYQWDMGNGNFIINQNATTVYNSANIYPVNLIVTLGNGCTSSVTHNVTVKPAPTANFVYGADRYNYRNISFENASHITAGTLSYSWNYGDGNTSTALQPNHVFTNDGTYPVKLVAISNEYGCKDSVTKSITIKDSLFASFDINNFCQCITVNDFAFTNQSGGSVGPYTYAWNFGDGTNSTLEYPGKKYATPGEYNVTLTVTNVNGTHASVTRVLRVGAKPTAGFNATANATYNYSFTNTSTIPSGNISSYWWNFGDGTVSADKNPTKTFSAVGTYHVQLVAVSDGGCTDTITKTIAVSNSGGGGGSSICTTPSFTVNDSSQCITDNHYVFTNTTTACTGCALTYEWNFGDGTYAYTKNAEKTYTQFGEYDVVLKITDCNGNTSQTLRQLYVGDKPHASFNILTNTGSGHDYTFLSTSTVVLGPITYAWDFGNGNTSTLSNPIVSLSAGTHNVKLLVNGRGTCKDTTSQIVNVAAAPVADFTFSRNGCTSSAEAFIFTNTTTGGAPTVTYLWNFGDGATSTAKNPSHYYLYPNSYTITLTATDANNNSSTKSVTIQSQGGAQPHADFNIIANTVNGNSYTFISSSTISSGWMTYAWNLGDGSTSTLVNPTKTYSAVGTYNVKLVVTGSSGCKDSITKAVVVNTISNNSITVPPISVYPNPVVDYAAVTFTPPTTGTVSIRLVSLWGQIVKTQTASVTANTQTSVNFNLANVAKDAYYIIIYDAQGNHIGTQKLQKK